MKRAPKTTHAVSPAKTFPLKATGIGDLLSAFNDVQLAHALSTRTAAPAPPATWRGLSWTPTDTLTMKSASLAVVIRLVTSHEKAGRCDAKVRESLLAMKLEIDRAIRLHEKEGVPRLSTEDLPIDLG
jgi:hypothetical protein